MRIVAPGRVNLIGDHTDYTGGLVFPMAISLATELDVETGGRLVHLESSAEPGTVQFSLDDPFDAQMQPRWGRYVAAVAAQFASARGIRGAVATTIPVGAGLSSSAALEVAVALAMGFDDGARELALLAQRAEQLATGVPTGIMDQLCIASARAGTATLIDCRSLDVTHVHLPDDVEFVVRFVAHRTLEGSEYAERVARCADAERIVGPLRDATPTMLRAIDDDIVRARARHVVSENARVLDFVAGLRNGDYHAAGELMNDSHRSLATDFAVSNRTMDDAVAAMQHTPGVFGARMTGGGFGGCLVAMCRPGAVDAPGVVRVTPSEGAHIL